MNRDSVFDLFMVFLIVTLSGYFIFQNLGEGSYRKWDEAIHVSYSRRISEYGLNFIVVDAFKYVKPPFFFIVVSLLYDYFGETLFISRVLTASFGVLTVFATFLFSKTFFDRKTTLLSIFFLFTSSQFILYSRLFMLDVPTVFAITLSIFWFVKYLRCDLNKYLVYSILCFVVAFLIRYWIAFIIIPIVAISFFDKTKLHRKKGFGINLVLIFLLVIFLVLLSKLLFPYAFEKGLLKNIYYRFNGVLLHHAPTTYYFYILYLSLQPFSLLLPLVLFYLVKKFRDTSDHLYLVLFNWIFLPPILLTFFKTKLCWYILPVYPAIALGLALFFSDMVNKISVRTKEVYSWIAVFLIIIFCFFHIDFPHPLNCFSEIVDIKNYLSENNVENVYVGSQINDRFYLSYVYFEDDWRVVTYPELENISDSGELFYIISRLENISGFEESKNISLIHIIRGGTNIVLSTNDPKARVSANILSKKNYGSQDRYCYRYFKRYLY